MQRLMFIFCAITFLFTASANAYVFLPIEVSRAVDLATAWIKDHPAGAEGYFFLGRVNGSAWARGETEVNIDPPGDGTRQPQFVPWESLMFERNPNMEMTPESKKFLIASIAAYRKAVEIDAKNPLYQLGLGWSLEQAANAHLKPAVEIDASGKLTSDEQKQCEDAIALLGNADIKARNKGTALLLALMPRCAERLLAAKRDNPEVKTRIGSIVRAYWLKEAFTHYSVAYRTSIDKDLNAQLYDDEADNTVSVKAGERLLAIQEIEALTPSEEIKKIKASIQAIKAKQTVGHVYG